MKRTIRHDYDENKIYQPPTSPEERDNLMISLAVDCAERQLREGTASSQVIVHYLKLATTREQLELELLKKQMELVTAKTEELQSAKRVEELYANAMQAFGSYSPTPDQETDEES